MAGSLIAKIKSRRRIPVFREVVVSDNVFSLPDNLSDSVEYSPQTNIDTHEWFKISEFSTTNYYWDRLNGDNFSSFDVQPASRCDIKNFQYFIFCQDNNYFFQVISKKKLIQKKSIFHLGEEFTINDNVNIIELEPLPHAIYLKDSDELFFKYFNKLSYFFKNINEIFKLATNEEIERLLQNDFMEVQGINIQDFSITVRKKITLVKDKIATLTPETLQLYIGYARQFFPNFPINDNKFLITNLDDLKILLNIFGEKYYNTRVTNEARYANSVTNI